MRHLPALVFQGCRCVLPMSDRSAALLAEVLLAEDPLGCLQALADQVAQDPPLLIWIATSARQRSAPGPESVAEAARWLVEHGVEVLRGEPQGEAALPAFREDAAQYAAHVEASLAVADLAAILASGAGKVASDKACLDGLLHRASEWLALAAAAGGAEAPGQWPGGAFPAAGSAVNPAVREAMDILAGRKEAHTAGVDPQTCRRRARAGTERWLEVWPGPGRCLPQLAARLARLDALERRFQETLETEKLEAMAEFAAGAGHEINNPLAIIAGRAQLLLKDETDPERRRELALVNAQVRRAHEMIADMRLFARPPRPELRQVDLAALVDGLLAEIGPQAAERGIALRRSGDPGPLELEADPAQLSVAVHALCRNAMEAIGRVGRIEVALGGTEHAVEIRVSDDGPGILPEHRRHLFDPFYSARQAGRGLGLGLSKCWRIAANHRGRITVASQPGEGAVFTILLPRRQPCHEP